MPPLPRVVVEIDPKEWERCCVEAGLTGPQTIRFRRFPPKSQRIHGRPVYGEAQKTPPCIYIYLCIEQYDHARFRDVHNELIDTILHELRHLYQFKTWPQEKWISEVGTPYEAKPSEIDAERWAKKNRSEYKRIAKIRRVYRSNLGRIDAAQARVLGS